APAPAGRWCASAARRNGRRARRGSSPPAPRAPPAARPPRRATCPPSSPGRLRRAGARARAPRRGDPSARRPPPPAGRSRRSHTAQRPRWDRCADRASARHRARARPRPAPRMPRRWPPSPCARVPAAAPPSRGARQRVAREDQLLHGAAPDQMLLDDPLEHRRRAAAVPDAVGIHPRHGPALADAKALDLGPVDSAPPAVETELAQAALQELPRGLGLLARRAVAVHAQEDVPAELADAEALRHFANLG